MTTRQEVATETLHDMLALAARTWHELNPNEPRGMDYSTSGNGFLQAAESAYLRTQPDLVLELPTLPEVAPGEHVVYVVRDRQGEVIYVGVTSHFAQRMAAHRSSSGWWPAAAAVKVSEHATRQEANEMETDCIRFLRPPWNRTYR